MEVLSPLWFEAAMMLAAIGLAAVCLAVAVWWPSGWPGRQT